MSNPIQDQDDLKPVRADDTMKVWALPGGARITEHPPAPIAVERARDIHGFLSLELVPGGHTVTERRKIVGLPPTPFLYTLDQVAQMLQMTDSTLRRHVYFSGISQGMQPEKKMLAANLEDPGDKADWRIADAEFIRWLIFKGYRVYDAWGLSPD
jgi:hypothetical protein